MPAYNSEKYIMEAIDSVINQSYQDWELLIVDDGSTDQTPYIVDEYAKKDLRINVFHKENEGVSKARNLALDHVTGEFVTFIDSDDIYHKDRLMNMIEVFKQNEKCDVVFSRHKEFTGQFQEFQNNSTQHIEMINDNVLKKVISDTKNHFMCNMIIKSEIAKKERFASIRFAEDFCYIRDCAYHCKQIAILDDILYYYRRDNQNAMTSHFFTEKYVPDYMKLVENVYDFCKKHQLNDDFFKKMVAHEYAQNSMRIRKSTSYLNFVKCMNDKNFRKGLSYADSSQCTLFERILYFMIKHKIYIPFAFWIW